MDHLGTSSARCVNPSSSTNSTGAAPGSKGLKISIIGHCIICLRKLKTVETTATSKRTVKVSGSVDEVEVAKKSVVSQPGFLTTFNEIWTVFQNKASDGDNNGKGTEGTTAGVPSLEKVNNLITRPKISVNFPSAPPMCEQCCSKVVNVENLMKAVRQQIKEIQMLLEWSRNGGRFGGRMEEFGKTLRENKVEEDVIEATLRFVQMLGCPGGPEKGAGDPIARTTNSVKSDPETTPMECDEDNSCGNGSDLDDREDNQGTRSADEDVHQIKSEEEEDEVPLEEDPVPVPVREADPLALPPPKPIKIYTCDVNNCGKIFYTTSGLYKHKKRCVFNPVIKAKLEKGYKFGCTCGRRFLTKKERHQHMLEEAPSHPNFKFSVSHRKGQHCDLCEAPVLSSNILEHLTKHVGAEHVVKCPNDKCLKMFTNSVGLQYHLGREKSDCKEIAKEKKSGLICETCGYTGDHLMNLRSHVENCHELVGTPEEKKWRCPIEGCGKMFCVKQSVYYHLQVHRSKNVKISTTQRCDKCGKDVKLEEMEGHFKDKHGIEEGDVIGCRQCRFKFSERDRFVEHLHLHLKEGIICDICGDGGDKWFVYGDFREHYLEVHGYCEKKYSCEECGKRFWRKQFKNVHKATRHVNVKPSKRITCDLCVNSVVYFNNVDFLSHRIKVHGADPFICDVCGERFDERRKLTKHKMEEHKGIKLRKEWRCEVEGCGKVYKKKKCWKVHGKVVHGLGGDEDGGIVCETCGKVFVSAGSLRTHYKSVHLGERGSICEECGERFTNSMVLKRHKLIHTGERPFGCDICGQRFRHRDVRNKHLRSHEEKGVDFKPNGPMKKIRKRRK